MINRDFLSLKAQIHYDPDTGVFTRKVSAGRGAKKGDVPGWIDKSNGGYRLIRLDGKRYKAARLAFLYVTGEWPKNQIDHTNHDRLDDRWENLREVTHKENMRNRTMQRNNTSGVTGVQVKRDFYGPGKHEYRAQIRADGKVKGLYRGHDFFEAVCARKSAENKYGFHENHGRA